MKEYINKIIREFVKLNNEGLWGEPLVGFADAKSPEFARLKTLIDPRHAQPRDIISDASVVISYFVPFLREISETNKKGGIASPEWARAYEKANAMFSELNGRLILALNEKGFNAAVPKEALTFDREKVISLWSQRHIARIAGLGSFGLNNMLITKKGCCGRINSVVTNAPIAPNAVYEKENCIYKQSGKCGVCAAKCPSGALSKTGYDRQKCFALCRENAKLYKAFGGSYGDDNTGSEVCGKCVCGMPCAFL